MKNGNKEFVLELCRILKGSPLAKISFLLITIGGGILNPSIQVYILNAALEFLELKGHIQNTPTLPAWSGLIPILLGCFFLCLEYKRLITPSLKDSDKEKLENIDKKTSETAENTSKIESDIRAMKIESEKSNFLTSKTQIEKECIEILRRLINKQYKMNYEHIDLYEIGEKALNNDIDVPQYIDTVLVGGLNEKAKLDFYSIIGEGEKCHPLAYLFLRKFENEIINKSKELGCFSVIEGTPLYQAYQNISSDAFRELRKKAYWEKYID